MLNDENAAAVVAARVKLFPPQALLARLDHQLPLLIGGARDLLLRQQTIWWLHPGNRREGSPRQVMRLAGVASAVRQEIASPLSEPIPIPR